MSRLSRLVGVLALAVCAGVAAAAGGTAPAEDTAQAEGAQPAEARPAVYGAATSGGSFYVEWSPEPSPVPLNELFAVRFRVLDPADRETPVAGAAVTADAWMPEHGHGTTLTPRVDSHGDGTATGEGFLLHMEGRWELRVGVAVDGRMERAVFEVVVGP